MKGVAIPRAAVDPGTDACLKLVPVSLTWTLAYLVAAWLLTFVPN